MSLMLAAKPQSWRFSVSHKSLIKNLFITQAGRAHSGSHSKRYRFAKGEHRLTVKEGRDESHYPLNVAETYLRESIQKLSGLLSEVEALRAQFSTGEPSERQTATGGRARSRHERGKSNEQKQ